jgi:hypothetical protein
MRERTVDTHVGRLPADGMPSRAVASARFNWAFALLTLWPAGGAYLDGWAHRHVPTLETFFTPWHAVLYSGMLACLSFLAIAFLRNQAAGAHWRHALPAGYGLSLIGAVLFGVGGVLDLGWHTVFGIERSVSALLSPTHLLLMTSMALLGTGPLRAAGLSRTSRATWPALISAALLLSVFTFFTQFNNPLIDQWAAAPAPRLTPRAVAQAEGIAGVIMYAGLLGAVILLLLRRFTLPVGALTLLFTLNAILVTGLVGFDRIIVLCAVNGLVADLVLWQWARVRSSVAWLRGFVAFALSFYFLTYFIGLWAADGLWWPVHLWTGCIAIAGITGWLLSYVFFPPISMRIPEAAPARARESA